MLTNEIVLRVFAEYLQQDKDYEVVLTSHGYTVMGWDCCREDWQNVVYCPTPEALRDALLDAYSGFAETKMTDENDRDLTDAETKRIEAECRALAEKCEQEATL